MLNMFLLGMQIGLGVGMVIGGLVVMGVTYKMGENKNGTDDEN